MTTTFNRGVRRAILGLAAAATIAVTGANAAHAVGIHANTSDGRVKSFDIVATADETHQLREGGTGFNSTGDLLCAWHGPSAYAFFNYGLVMNEVHCGEALTGCAKALTADQLQDHVAAVQWDPHSGVYKCITYVTGQAAADLFVLASQIPPGNGG